MVNCSICGKYLGRDYDWLESKSFKKLKVICDACRNTYQSFKLAPEPKKALKCLECHKLIKIARASNPKFCWRCSPKALIKLQEDKK